MLKEHKPEICPLLGAPMPTTVSRPDPSRLIKSGARVLEILEWFSDNRRPAIAQEIAQVLGLPVSSTSDLLKSLVETGHLLFTKENKSYFPSPRVLRLSLSVLPQNLDSTGVTGIMRELQAETGECVSVSAQNGRHMQFIHILPTPGVVLNHVHEGLKFPLVGSASGLVVLATMTDANVIGEAKKAATGYTARSREVLIQTTLQHARLARKRGYGVSFLNPLPFALSIAVTLHTRDAHQPLALCVGGTKANFEGHEHNIAAKMRRAVAEYMSINGELTRAG